jgi:hypothetical protein
MNDLIRRQDAIDAFWKLEVEIRPSAIYAIDEMLKQLPSVGDMVSRQNVIEIFSQLWDCIEEIADKEEWEDVCKTTANEIPSAQPQINPASYMDCARALLTMWIDNIITDSEYNRIINKLNANELKRRTKDE